MSTRWTPSFLSRLFFKGSWTIEISPNGLIIDDRVHPWESLTQCSLERTLLWGHLQMQFAAEVIALRGMPRSLANEIASCAKAFQTLLPAIVALRTAMASERYVANRTVRETLAIAGDTAERWSLDQAPRVAADLEPLRPDLEFIRQVASGNYSEIEARNNQFISAEMAIHEDFFNTVCPTCQRGRLLPRVSVHGTFMVCERKDRGFSNCANIQGHIPPRQNSSHKQLNPQSARMHAKR